MTPDHLLNPLGYAEATELPFEVVEAKNWTEHYFFFGHDAAQGYGMCAHIGRLPSDPTIWRAVVQVYLPGDELLVAKFHGRDGDVLGPGAGAFKLDCITPFRTWLAKFDGAAFTTTRQQITSSLAKDGPAEPLKFEMRFEGAGPMYGPHVEPGFVHTAGSFHSEQVCHMTGSITLRGETVTLSGLGVRDHSSGARDYGPVVSTVWIHALFPSGKIIHIQKAMLENGEVSGAYVYRGDGSPFERGEIVECPPMPTVETPAGSVPSDPMTENGGRFSFAVKVADRIERAEGQLLHAHAASLSSPVEELNGTDFDNPAALQMCEAPATVTCDGEVGVALRERTTRVSQLFVSWGARPDA